MQAALIGRLRELFDMYSPNPLSRGLVLLTMGLGVMLLARSVTSGSGIGAVPFVLLLWANHERFLSTLEEIFERHTWFVLAIPLAVFVAKMLMEPPTASDDLLRHIASAFWAGGYRDMYVHTALPPASLYPSFDWFAGGLAKMFGLANAMWTMQALAFGAFVGIFVAAAHRKVEGTSTNAVFVLVALVVVLGVMVGRLALARPEIFVTSWALAALLVRGRTSLAVWAVAGTLLGSGYWLAPIYFPAVLLLPLSGRLRIAVAATLTCVWALIWMFLTNGGVLEVALWTFEQVANRIPGVEVSENASIVNVLLAPQMLALVIGSAWAARQPATDNRLLLLAMYFMLSNQARYGGIVAPLLALHVLSAMRDFALLRNMPWRSIAVALAAVSLSLTANTVPRYAALPKFALPDGAIVLTGFSEATYSTLFANPGRIRIAPSFEVGAASMQVQRLVKSLSEGDIDCIALESLAFTHLIENTLASRAKRCLSLQATQGNWRLWQIDESMHSEK